MDLGGRTLLLCCWPLVHRRRLHGPRRRRGRWIWEGGRCCCAAGRLFIADACTVRDVAEADGSGREDVAAVLLAACSSPTPARSATSPRPMDLGGRTLLLFCWPLVHRRRLHGPRRRRGRWIW